MPAEIKYIHTEKLEAREVRVIESFLNLIGDDPYKLVFDLKKEYKPNVILVDELYHSDEINHNNPSSLVLVIGDDTGNPDPTYLHRPIQWSKFQSALKYLKEQPDLTVEADLTQILEVDGQQEDQDKSRSYRIDGDGKSGHVTYKEADKAGSISVKQLYTTEKPKIQELIASEEDDDIILSLTDVQLADEYIDLDRLGSNINFWDNESCQVIVGGRPVLFVKAEKGMVYSEYGFDDWEPLLRAKDARKSSINNDWAPSGKMKSYPIRWLAWASAHARSKGYLLAELDRNHYFLLNKWPDFDLLYNNNEHLKLCGLMFKEGHSIQELVSKTHIRARIIIGLINACQRHGILSSLTLWILIQ